MGRCLFVAVLLILLTACASHDERMTDTRNGMARDRNDCLLGRDVAGEPIESRPVWCRDKEEAGRWSSSDTRDHVTPVDFKPRSDDAQRRPLR